MTHWLWVQFDSAPEKRVKQIWNCSIFSWP